MYIKGINSMGGGGASTASGTSFDNTTAQLPNNPDNVQNAIEEVALCSSFNYTTPTVVGKWHDGKDIYRTKVTHTQVNVGTNTALGWDDFGSELNIDTLIGCHGGFHLDASYGFESTTLLMPYVDEGNTVGIQSRNGALRSFSSLAGVFDLVLDYTIK